MTERPISGVAVLKAVAMLALAAGLVAFGAIVFGGRRAAQPAGRVERTAAPAARLEETHPAPPPEPPAASEPAPAPPPPDPVLASPPPEPETSIETVVSRALPAVVRVGAGSSRGSGFFVSSDTLRTNAHVVGENFSVTVHTGEGADLPARVETVSRTVDLAVLKVSPVAGQPVIPLGSAYAVRPGAEVIAIGSALGSLQNTVTRGIVSALRQTGTALLVQTDAAANPGNSGGPLLDRDGIAIGVTTMGFQGRQGLNFAVAIDYARDLLTGRSTPPPAAADPGLEALSPARPSTADASRTDGATAFEASLRQLARRADALDAYWSSFVADCYGGSVAGDFARPWFALFDEHVMTGAVAPGCAGALAQLRQSAQSVRNDLLAADEHARRAGVFPGTRRELRRRYHLDNPAWTP
jgi:S1-C subfamily serine protease